LEGLVLEEAAPRLVLGFALGVKGLGGVLSIRLRTSSSLGGLFMSALKPLEASFEKISRAKAKLSHLMVTVNALNQVGGCTVRFQNEPEGVYIVVRREKDIPGDFAWEMVEAVGHLRSALDKICIDLVEINGRGLSGVGFPFGGLDNAKPLPFPDGRIENGIKKKLTPDQWNLIASYQPYPGGNNTLWAINEIANADKHRKGLVSTRGIVVSPLAVIGCLGAGLTYGPTSTGSLIYDQERETVIALIHEARNLKISLTPAIHVVFGDIAPVTGKNVIKTLDDQIGLVTQITEACRQFF
jgi:hypothetical protein